MTNIVIKEQLEEVWENKILSKLDSLFTAYFN